MKFLNGKSLIACFTEYSETTTVAQHRAEQEFFEVHDVSGSPAEIVGAMSEPQRIDGVDVFIEGGGSESIVMVHGWPDSFRLWDDQVDYFNAHYRCIRFTLPGFDGAAACRLSNSTPGIG